MTRKKQKKEEDDTIWGALGISVERYDEIESLLLSALVLSESKTEVIDSVNEKLVGETERRAFEVMLLSYCGELLPLRLLSSIGLLPGKIMPMALADMKNIDCNNPECPVHGGDKKKGGKQDGRKKDGNTNDPMVR